MGVLYVLDEPSIGLHPRDNTRLLRTLKGLRDLGNSVIVVEHDSETILSADWVLDPDRPRSYSALPEPSGYAAFQRNVADALDAARGQIEIVAAEFTSQFGRRKVGALAPAFSLARLDGDGTVSLASLRGKTVILNFWASWCPPCRAEMPAIEKVYRSHKDLGLEVLGVNTTNQDSQTAAAAFVQEVGVTFPILFDRSGAVSAGYTLQGLPTSFFIDCKGVIRSVVVGGPMSEALIQSKVEELLREGQ